MTHIATCILALWLAVSVLATAEPNLGVVAVRLATGIDAPVSIDHAPGDTSRLFVVEQKTGNIRIVNLPAGTTQATPFLTVTGLATGGSEEGLLGLAFHPNYVSNRYFYINCTAPRPGGGGNRTEIRRYSRSASNPNVADTSSTLILAYDQPQANHNGGWLGFGLDGHLYIASGDGGGGGDNFGTIGNAQNRNTLLGKLLRIDVNSGSPYANPPGNPYLGISGQREELWAIGLRNPWRCDIDPDTGDIWIGDVGQGDREEISFAPADQAGMNFGWRPWEGNFRVRPGETPVSAYTPPVLDYNRGTGTCIIGGCIYRGRAMPGLSGTYFYADFNSSRYWSLRRSSSGVLTDHLERTLELRNGTNLNNPSSFGRDADGELYVTDHSSDEVWKLVSSLAVTGGPTLAPTTVGASTTRSLTSTGGRAPTTWSLSSGALPAGMTLAAGTGIISGSPTTSGTATFTLRATDANGARVDRACTLLVNAAPTVTTATLPDATLGAAYSATLVGSAGTTPYTWVLASGTLPSGLSLAANGTISGSATGTTATVSVRLTDAVGITATRSLTITVLNGLGITTAATFPAATVGAAVNRTVTAAGGITPYTWTISAGALPAGLTMSTAGVITGAPTTAVNASFTVRVQDNAGANTTRACTWVINAAPIITTATLPGGTPGVVYSATLAATGGTPGLTWSLATGTLPTGLNLSGAGTITGTPSAAATASFTVRVTDNVGATATRALSIAITSAPTFTSTATLNAWVNEAWTYDADAAGTPAPTFGLTVAPTGMTINPTSGLISWTPTSTGSANVTVQAANGVNPNAQQSFTLTVSSAGISTRRTTPAYLGMPTTATGFPAQLSQTGTFSDLATLTPIPAMIPYQPNHPFWSDRASKRRWVAVPNDGAPYGPSEQVGWSATGSWTWPAGTVFVKHFDLPLSEVAPTPVRRLETRILVKTTTRAYGVTYRWNGANADVVTTGQNEDITITTASGTRTQRWYYPSPADCMSCHTEPAGYVLGASTRQLNSSYFYPNGITENQLTAWSRANLFDRDPGTPGALTALAAINSGASLETRARSYLDANCAPCHLPGGAPAVFDARYDTPLTSQNLIGGTVGNNLGISGAQVVVAGDPDRSILWRRLHSTDPAIRMPNVGRLEIDQEGSDLIRDWIDSTASTPAVNVSSGTSAKCGMGLGLLLALALGLLLRGRLRR